MAKNQKKPKIKSNLVTLAHQALLKDQLSSLWMR